MSRQRPVRGVAFEDGDDLVVGFAAVDHAQPADRAGCEQEVAARQQLFP